MYHNFLLSNTTVFEIAVFVILSTSDGKAQHTNDIDWRRNS